MLQLQFIKVVIMQRSEDGEILLILLSQAEHIEWKYGAMGYVLGLRILQYIKSSKH